MTTEMHPAMRVERSYDTEERQLRFELVLSRANFNYLAAGCPEGGALIGRSPCGTLFYLFPDPHGRTPASFQLMPDGDGYYAYVGAPVPRVPEQVSSEEFDRLAQEADDNLEKAINESGKIPIKERMGERDLSIGYVVMRVEKEVSPTLACA